MNGGIESEKPIISFGVRSRTRAVYVDFVIFLKTNSVRAIPKLLTFANDDHMVKSGGKFGMDIVEGFLAGYCKVKRKDGIVPRGWLRHFTPPAKEAGGVCNDEAVDYIF